MIALAHITTYLNIFVRNLRLFEYFRTLTFQWSEYWNNFTIEYFYIRISNIRPKIFATLWYTDLFYCCAFLIYTSLK